jgi:hypothetical protein
MTWHVYKMTICFLNQNDGGIGRKKALSWMILWMNICLWMVPLAIQAASFQERVESMQWHEIEAEARGQTVNWHMWGGEQRHPPLG